MNYSSTSSGTEYQTLEDWHNTIPLTLQGQERKPFILIIGSKQSGKSSIIRSLTGKVVFDGISFAETASRANYIHVIEGVKRFERISTLELDIEMTTLEIDECCNGVIFEISLENDSNSPIFEKIINHVYHMKFKLHVFIVSPGIDGVRCDEVKSISRLPRSIPSIHIIDGQRLPFENASFINSITNIIDL